MLVDMTQTIVAENTRIAQNQDEYQKRYDSLVERYEKSKSRYDEITYDIEQKQARQERLRQFEEILKSQDSIITEFDDALWSSMVEFITVGRDTKTVRFEDGTEITV